MKFSIDVNKLAQAIDIVLDSDSSLIEIDFYDVIKFDNLKLYEDDKITRIQNDLEEYDNIILDIYSASNNTRVNITQQQSFSQRRHLLNDVTHVKSNKYISNLFVNQAEVELNRDRFFQQFLNFTYSVSNFKFVPPPRRLSSINAIPISFITYAAVRFSEEAVRTFSLKFIAYYLIKEFLYKLHANMLREMQFVSTTWIGTPILTTITPPNPNILDVINSFFIFNSYNDFTEESVFNVIFTNVEYYRRFLSMKSTTGSYLLDINKFNDVYMSDAMKVYAVPNITSVPGLGSQHAYMFTNTNVLLLSDFKLLLSYNKDTITNEHVFNLEMRQTIVPRLMNHGLFSNSLLQVSAVSYVDVNSMITVV